MILHFGHIPRGRNISFSCEFHSLGAAWLLSIMWSKLSITEREIQCFIIKQVLMDTMTKPIFLPRDCANLSIPPANMSVSHIPKPSVLNDKWMNERAEWNRLYMGGAWDSNCRRETNQIHKATAKHHGISHTARSVDSCTIKQARALVLLQSSCLEAVIHVLHNWDPQHKCVWERERETT